MLRGSVADGCEDSVAAREQLAHEFESDAAGSADYEPGFHLVGRGLRTAIGVVLVVEDGRDVEGGHLRRGFRWLERALWVESLGFWMAGLDMRAGIVESRVGYVYTVLVLTRQMELGCDVDRFAPLFMA